MRLAARLGDAVRLEWPVRTISQDSGGVVVAGEAGEVRARRAIVAIPPTLAGRLVYGPTLPGGRDQLTQRLPGGSVVKFNLVYPTPWWRERGLRGFVYCPDEAVSMMFDATPAEGEPGVIVGFMEGAKGVEAATLAAAERRTLVIEQAERALGPLRSRASATSIATGAPRNGPGAAMALTSRPESGPSSDRRFASPSVESIGPARKPRSDGWDTSTAQSNPASELRTKCSRTLLGPAVAHARGPECALTHGRRRLRCAAADCRWGRRRH